MPISDRFWCWYTLRIASESNKPILAIRPSNYNRPTPEIIRNVETEGGVIDFDMKHIVQKICHTLNFPAPLDLNIKNENFNKSKGSLGTNNKLAKLINPDLPE